MAAVDAAAAAASAGATSQMMTFSNDEPTTLPQAFLRPALGVHICTLTMLHAIHDLPGVIAAVGPFVAANAAFCTIDILPFVLATIRKMKRAVAMHLAVHPFPIIPTAIIPRELTPAVVTIVGEATSVGATLLVPLVRHLALTALLALDKLSSKHSAVRKGQAPPAMLTAFVPLATIHGAIRKFTGAQATGSAVSELTLVLSPVRQVLGALSIRALIRHAIIVLGFHQSEVVLRLLCQRVFSSSLNRHVPRLVEGDSILHVATRPM